DRSGNGGIRGERPGARDRPAVDRGAREERRRRHSGGDEREHSGFAGHAAGAPREGPAAPAGRRRAPRQPTPALALVPEPAWNSAMPRKPTWPDSSPSTTT